MPISRELLPFSFQFCFAATTRLAAIFAEEVDDFCGVVWVVWISSKNNAGNAARIKTIESMTKRFWAVSLVLLT